MGPIFPNACWSIASILLVHLYLRYTLPFDLSYHFTFFSRSFYWKIMLCSFIIGLSKKSINLYSFVVRFSSPGLKKFNCLKKNLCSCSPTIYLISVIFVSLFFSFFFLTKRRKLKSGIFSGMLHPTLLFPTFLFFNLIFKAHPAISRRQTGQIMSLWHEKNPLQNQMFKLYEKNPQVFT